MTSRRTWGAEESGGRVAAPIFGAFMERALGGVPNSPFRIPDGVDMVRIDAETGQRRVAGVGAGDPGSVRARHRSGNRRTHGGRLR